MVNTELQLGYSQVDFLAWLCLAIAQFLSISGVESYEVTLYTWKALCLTLARRTNPLLYCQQSCFPGERVYPFEPATQSLPAVKDPSG